MRKKQKESSIGHIRIHGRDAGLWPQHRHCLLLMYQRLARARQDLKPGTFGQSKWSLVHDTVAMDWVFPHAFNNTKCIRQNQTHDHSRGGFSSENLTELERKKKTTLTLTLGKNEQGKYLDQQKW